MFEQKKVAPVSLQELLLSKNQKLPVPEVVVVADSIINDSMNDDSMELRTETTFQIDQVYDHDDSPAFFKARKQHGTKKTVVFDIEQELEGISVMVYNEDGQGGGIDGICAFNDIQNLAGYNVEHSSLAETQKEQKQQQIDSEEQCKTVSSNELMLKDEIKELRSKNEILTLQLARQLADIQNQSEQLLTEGSINRQLQVENESIQRDRVHLRRIVATLENEVKRLEVELNERTVTHSRMNESMVATEQLVSQLESESAILQQVRADLETSERDRAQLRRLVSSLEAEVIAIKTENSQLRCSLATASLTGSHTGGVGNHTGEGLTSTSSFDYSIDSTSVLPVPPPINRQTSSHPPTSAIVNTSASAVVSSNTHRVENRQDRRRTMSSIDFRESQEENNNKLPLKRDQPFSTKSIPIDVSRTVSSRDLLARDPSLQVEENSPTLISQPYRQQQQQQHQQVPPSHHEQRGHKMMNDHHDQYEHSNNSNNNNNNNNSSALSTSQLVSASTASTAGRHNGQGLAVDQMAATPNRGGTGTSNNGGTGTGMQSLAQLIGGFTHNNGVGGGVGGILTTTNGFGSMGSSSVHTRRHASSSSYEESSLSSSLDKTENENYPRTLPNGATPTVVGSLPTHYTHQTTQPTSSMGASRSLEQFITMKPPSQQPQSQPQPQTNIPLMTTKGEVLAFNANLHANAMHIAGNNNTHHNNNSSSRHEGTKHSTHASSDRTLFSQQPPSSSIPPINLNAWKQEGYPSEFAYAKAMGMLDIGGLTSNQPNNSSNQPVQSVVVSTIVPTIIRSRGHGQPMVSTTPFGTDDTVCQDLVAYDELEKHLTSMMSEKRSLNEESERLLQRGGKTLKERTRLTQVEYRLGELNKEISSTRKELTRKS